MEGQLLKIAQALEKNNELFKKWIQIHLEYLTNENNRRAELFLHELQLLKNNVAMTNFVNKK